MIPIDRFAAATRAAWRVLIAGLLFGAARLLWQSIEWPLMWRTDAISCMAMGAVLGLLLIPTLLVAVSAARWLLLALWPARTAVVWSDDRVQLCLGPFGRRDLDRAHMHIEDAGADVPAKFADEFVPRLFHPAYAGDMAAAILRFTRLPAGELRRLLVQHGWIAEEDEDDAEDRPAGGSVAVEQQHVAFRRKL